MRKALRRERAGVSKQSSYFSVVTGNPPSNFHRILAPSSQERPPGFLLFLLAETKSLTRSNFEKEGFILACSSRLRHSLSASPVSGGNAGDNTKVFTVQISGP